MNLQICCQSIINTFLEGFLKLLMYIAVKDLSGVFYLYNLQILVFIKGMLANNKNLLNLLACLYNNSSSFPVVWGWANVQLWPEDPNHELVLEGWQPWNATLLDPEGQSWDLLKL